MKLAEIGWNFADTQRKEYTRLQVSLFQFISRYPFGIRVLILYIIPYKPYNSNPHIACGYSRFTSDSSDRACDLSVEIPYWWRFDQNPVKRIWLVDIFNPSVWPTTVAAKAKSGLCLFYSLPKNFWFRPLLTNRVKFKEWTKDIRELEEVDLQSQVMTS